MIKPLHLPLDFCHRDEVRTLSRILAVDSAIYVLKMWLDWGRDGLPLRLFKGKPDNLTYLIEQYADCEGPSGRLVEAAIEAGVIVPVDDGYLLMGFEEFNRHLHPKSLSIQAKGGLKKASLQRLRHATQDAPKQRRLLEQSEIRFPTEVKATEGEQDAALALVMGLDIACGRDLRKTGDYPETLLRDALAVIRHHNKESISAVQLWLMDHRDDVRAQVDAELVIRRFSDYLSTTQESLSS